MIQGSNFDCKCIINKSKRIDQKTVEEIMFYKKITLYFAKKDDLCVLYDYERIDSKEEV